MGMCPLPNEDEDETKIWYPLNLNIRIYFLSKDGYEISKHVPSLIRDDLVAIPTKDENNIFFKIINDNCDILIL